MEIRNGRDLVAWLDSCFLAKRAADGAQADSAFARETFVLDGKLIRAGETAGNAGAIDVLVIANDQLPKWRADVIDGFFRNLFDHDPVIRYARSPQGAPCHAVMVCLDRPDMFVDWQPEEGNPEKSMRPRVQGYRDMNGVVRMLVWPSPLMRMKRPDMDRLSSDMEMQLDLAWLQGNGEGRLREEIEVDEVPF